MRLHSSVLRATLCLAALTVGCGGDGGDAPTSPAPAPARTTLTLNLQFVEVIEDCDGIEGDGDFKLSVLVYSNIFPTDLIYRQTVNLGPGGRTPGGLHLRAPDGTPMANAMLGLLHRLGHDDLESFGDSQAAFSLSVPNNVSSM